MGERDKIPVDGGKPSDSDVLNISGLRLCLAFASLQPTRLILVTGMVDLCFHATQSLGYTA